MIDAARPEGPVTLLGISQGAAACIGYALKHPDRVARLILYGGYARGAYRRGTPESQATYRAMTELVRVAWGSDNPTYRQLFTSRFVPDASAEQLQWFNDLCLKTTKGEIAALAGRARRMDFEALLDKVQVPTLVLHARNDKVIPVEEGRLLASSIPGAEFVELDSRNHILLAEEPAWKRFQEAVLEFAGPQRPRAGRVCRAIRARAPGAGAHGGGTQQHGHRDAIEDQREDGPQSCVERLRQARRVVPHAGDRVCAGSGIPAVTRRTVGA